MGATDCLRELDVDGFVAFGGLVNRPDRSHVCESVAAVGENRLAAHHAVGEVIELLAHLLDGTVVGVFDRRAEATRREVQGRFAVKRRCEFDRPFGADDFELRVALRVLTGRTNQRNVAFEHERERRGLVGNILERLVRRGHPRARLHGFTLYLRWHDALPQLTASSDRRWFILGGIVSTLFLLGYYVALSIAPVSIVAPIVITNTLFVILLSILFMPTRLEKVTWRLVAAATVVFVGVFLITLFG